MDPLNQFNLEKIKDKMLSDPKALAFRYKTRKLDYEETTVPNTEVDDYLKLGYYPASNGKQKKNKTKLNIKKKTGRKFEDDIWCMFYNLGFRILNSDENLVIQWGPNDENTQQLDVVAVGEDAIFVVECKAAEAPKNGSFKKDLDCMEQYKEGVSMVLQKIYGKKKVKFIFATQNYRFDETGEDRMRMLHNGFFHLNDNTYRYINNLIKSYKTAVVYQFYALMFKDQLIDDNEIVIPALKGKMGNQNYYLFSVEPKTLLKVGFILHRTKVNDSMAPTYQRMLVPSRLNGITKFIDNGGYFPNSVIINFSSDAEKTKLQFRPIPVSTSSNTEFGFLRIPNAYGIAYIIDGQHRVYGYANSNHLEDNTVPVVAFENMSSTDQLKLFMDINQNQKAVSPSLRLDLVYDLHWTSDALDSRMSALRSCVVSQLSASSNSVLYNKISTGEDKKELKFAPFDNGLRRSGLVPQCTKTQWKGETDVCLYNVLETNREKAMCDARDKILSYINGVYSALDSMVNETEKKDFIYDNRPSFAIVALAGSLNSHLIHSGRVSASSSIKDRIIAVTPYLGALAEGINKMSSEERLAIRSPYGSGADPHWLHTYQDFISRQFPDYTPDELITWRETQNKSIQDQGNNLKDQILEMIKTLVFAQLESIYGPNWEDNFVKLKNVCQNRIIDELEDTEGFNVNNYDWKNWVDLSSLKKIIDNHFTQGNMAEIFTLPTNKDLTKRSEKLAWIMTINKGKGSKQILLTQKEVDTLEIISIHLKNFVN